MNIPPSTPFPVPSFQNADSDASPKQFLDFLRNLIAENFQDDDPSITKPASERDNWVTIVNGLSEHFLASFPSSNAVPWNAMHDKLELIDHTLEIITRVTSRVEAAYAGPGDAAKALFTHLLNLCNALDCWLDVEVTNEPGVPTPLQLRDKTVKAIVGLLRHLGSCISSGAGPDSPAWKNLREIMVECLDLTCDFLSLAGPLNAPFVVILFNKPRIQESNGTDVFSSASNETQNKTIVPTASHIPLYMSTILEVLSNVLAPALISQWFLTDIVRRTTEVARSIFDYCLSPACSTTAAKRVRSLSRIVASTSLLISLSSAFQAPLRNLLYRALIHRVHDGPKVQYEILDKTLERAFMDIYGSSRPGQVTQAVLEVVRIESWGEPGIHLRSSISSFLLCCVPTMNLDTLRTTKEALKANEHFQGPNNLMASIDKQLSSAELLGDGGTLNGVSDNARTKIRASVAEIIAPDEITWMEGDDLIDMEVYAERALQEIQNRFERPLHSTTKHDRLELADRLAIIPCTLSHTNQVECIFETGAAHKVYIVPSLLTVLARLLDGAEDQVTPLVRRKTYGALAQALRHHIIRGDEGLDHVADMAFRGMADKDRSVRLSAGRALVALLNLYHEKDESPANAEQIGLLYSHLFRLLDVSKPPIQETILITMGGLGKSPKQDALPKVVHCLVAQLGGANPVLKGTAYMQLIAMTRHHKKSSWGLVSPYMSQIAPFLVTSMCTRMSMLTEACHFLSITPSDFISATLQYTLPPLFASCDSKVLEQVAKHVTIKVSHLFLKRSAEILAHIFLLKGSTHTERALAFILQLLRTAADNISIDMQSIVKSCLVPLLAQLVIGMGDESREKAELAMKALHKVDKTLIPPSRAQRAPTQQDLGTFLKPWMLGIISDMNDMLQDVQGRKSVSEKRQILRGLAALINNIGPTISNVAPQIMATLQTTLTIPDLSDVVLACWYTFLSTLLPSDVGPHISPTTASFVAFWSTFSATGQTHARRIMEFIVLEIGNDLGKHMDDVVDLSMIPELHDVHQTLRTLRERWTPRDKLQRILERSSSDNIIVAIQALGELKTFMLVENREVSRDLLSGDIFDPFVGQMLSVLFAAACRDGDDTETLRSLAFECVGILGAVDPDRCEIGFNDPRMIVMSNFTDEGESVLFALHLIKDILVGAFRSTSDIKYQSHLAYSIQELLRFCKFTPALVASGSAQSVPLKVRHRWDSLPKHVLETVTPLLEARFTLNQKEPQQLPCPIYPNHSTYREWIQIWTGSLITQASGPTAQTIFSVFRSAVRNKDVGVAHHLLPHLVLNILISGSDEDAQNIRKELLVVLEDQVKADSSSSPDKKLLSAQAVFMLLDHLNKWVRLVRQDISNKKADNKRSRAHNSINSQAEEQLLRVVSMLSSINQDLMAKAALNCKAYARSLMNFERQIISLQEHAAKSSDLPDYYERLHEIYAHLDEPDGMEGVSTLILSPSLEHQIRQHESTGRWTSAQSCWEVRLQQSPDNLDFHLGLLRCLRNLGHYDTLRTHVKGVLTRNPGWESALAGFSVESAWMVGAWDDVENLVEETKAQSPSVAMARVLLAIRSGQKSAIADSLSVARSILGPPIMAAGAKGYRRSYDAVLDLHLTHELQIIHDAMQQFPTSSQGDGQKMRREILNELSKSLASRLESSLPTLRTREPLLSMRRTAFALSSRNAFTAEVGRAWLASAKIARKAGQWQTAYSAVLQAQQTNTRFSFMESAKLVKATGEPLRALQELENSMRLLGVIESNVIDLTEDNEDTKKMKAKAQVLRARWMNESERYDAGQVMKAFTLATELSPKWESGMYHLGQFYDECFKNLPLEDRRSRGTRMNLSTVKYFAKAIIYGSKYVYQTVPRLLTIWLDMGENVNPAIADLFKKLNTTVNSAIKNAPVYKWFTAFPQIVSRVGHKNDEVYNILSTLITTVISEYPKQALWLFTSVIKSTKANRQQRGRQILDQLRNNPANARTPVPGLIDEILAMTNELLALCDYPIGDDFQKNLSMKKDFKSLSKLGHSRLIIPLQESLTATLPPTSSNLRAAAAHQPFPVNTPTFDGFHDEIDVMRSLAKPRKITIQGSNGQIYMFLGKPKDDLRKDARLMDFNAIINKLLKANSESRRRQLHIRTYGVVTLNEECGFIQWVPNTIPIRPVLLKFYEAKRIKSWSGEMATSFKDIKDGNDKDAAKIFVTKVLPLFPPVFHEWFIETFPEPTAWLASRLAYGRTAAVMSMVGFILGLGDRHCENILLDNNTGDAVHVDFNCLFEKGKTLETPERVPFRLTQNMIDGLGVTGVEGVFRIACEVTMQLLRDNKDSLMSVLDAFIHDPLVEWEDEKRKLERDSSRRNQVKSSADLASLARNALLPIERKLKGIYSRSSSKEKDKQQKEVSTSNLVQLLIQEATDDANLAKMYPGWASWH